VARHEGKVVTPCLATYFLTEERKEHDLSLLDALGNRNLTTQRHIHLGLLVSKEKTLNKPKSSNACLKCPAAQPTETGVAMKFGKARMLGFRTYPAGSL